MTNLDAMLAVTHSPTMRMTAEPVAVADASLNPPVYPGAVEVAEQLNSDSVHVRVVRSPRRAWLGAHETSASHWGERHRAMRLSCG